MFVHQAQIWQDRIGGTCKSKQNVIVFLVLLFDIIFLSELVENNKDIEAHLIDVTTLKTF